MYKYIHTCISVYGKYRAHIYRMGKSSFIVVNAWKIEFILILLVEAQ